MKIANKDPGKFHFYVSLAKSIFRITGCIAVLGGAGVFYLAASFLVAELLGVVEEL